MKGKLIICLLFFATLKAFAAEVNHGWPENYRGVMLQGFYWDSFSDSRWTVLEKQADELAQYFSLVWIPQSGYCGGTSMGYDDQYWFSNYSSSFGTEAQLRSMISTFKSKGIGTIADVVINHRKSSNGWFGFPAETYNGKTYTMGPSDVCSNDDEGKAQTEANKLGVTLGNPDTGEGWDGMRDLDHTSQNVQNTVKDYLTFLLNDLGYAGFRYDMVKGYSGSYTGMYNAHANPTFSVGECWDGTSTIRNWIDATKVDGWPMSAAFDFQFRYTVRNAANYNNWTSLGSTNDGNWPLMSNNYDSGNYRRWAVTFVENHDTERRANAEQDPLKKDTLAANAYLLAMPGTPCVFLTHWIDCKQDIKAMIDVRHAAGIHSQSTYSVFASAQSHYAVCVDSKLLAVVGSNAAGYTPTNQNFVKVLSGYHYAYYLNKSLNMAWVDLASGTYEGAQQAMLTAVTSDSGAKVVYTTDGSTPTASSTQVTSGTKITIPAETTTTLKVGLLINGTVQNIITRQYTIKKSSSDEFTIPACCTRSANEVCAFFEAPSTWFSTVCCWAWTNSPADNFTFSQRHEWPGVDCVKVGTTDDGAAVWKWTWDGTKQNNTSATQPAFIIFNNTGSPQTNDMTFTNGGYYRMNKLMGVVTVTGIEDAPTVQPSILQSPSYDLQGRQVNGPLKKGIYIINKKKVVVK